MQRAKILIEVMDEYLVKQTQMKVMEDERKLVKPTSSILDSISDMNSIQINNRVRHSSFGEGTVMQITNDAYVILFDEVGLKGIRLDSKKIEKIR